MTRGESGAGKPIRGVAVAALNGCIIAEQPSNSSPRHVPQSAPSCAAAAVSDAVTLPRPDAEATRRDCSSDSAGSSVQLPSSQSPALKFEVSCSQHSRTLERNLSDQFGLSNCRLSQHYGPHSWLTQL